MKATVLVFVSVGLYNTIELLVLILKLRYRLRWPVISLSCFELHPTFLP